MRADDPAILRATLAAAVALVVFAAVSGLAVAGWQAQGADVVWTWKSLLTGGSAIVALVLSGLLMLKPARLHAVLGASAMLVSLARIGAPTEWTWRSFALVAVTGVLILPVAHAAMLLRDEP